MAREVLGQVPARPAGTGASMPTPTTCRLGEQFARALRGQLQAEGLSPSPPDAEAPAHAPWPPWWAPAPAPSSPSAPASDPAACAGLVPGPPHAPPATAASAPGPLIAAAGGHGTAAVVQAQQAALVALAAPAAVTAVESGSVWELTLNEPGGLALSVRAERSSVPGLPGTAGAAGVAPWSLAISAGAVNGANGANGTHGAELAAALQRHAPRLAERLAARALAPAHLRIHDGRDPRGD